MVKVYIVERNGSKRDISKIKLLGEFADEGYAIQFIEYYEVSNAYIVDGRGNVINY